MYIILGILIIFLILFVIYIFEINSIRKQLKEINAEKRTNLLIKTGFRIFGMENLVSEINNLIKNHRKIEIELENEKEKIKNQVASVSHDLRTPLTSILGYIEVLKTNEDAKTREKYTDIIQKKAQILQKLIEQFFEIALIEDTKYEIEKEKVYPGILLEDTIMAYYQDFSSVGIELQIKIKEDLETVSNRNALSRIYSNLIANMLNHGESFAEISQHIEGERLVTKFKNKIKTGEKIDEEKIFEKFYRAETSRHSNSTGIGMYASKILAEKLDHEISSKVSDGYFEVKIRY